MVPLLVTLVLGGCTKPPVYNGITTITVHTQTGAGGTNREELVGERLIEASNCLYQTSEIEQPVIGDTNDLLQAVVLIQVKDRLGDRMFELYTDKNFKGNKGKYYKSSCIYRIIRK